MSGTSVDSQSAERLQRQTSFLLAVWEDAGHIEKAGVSVQLSSLAFKKAIQRDPLVNSQLNGRKPGNTAHELGEKANPAQTRVI